MTLQDKDSSFPPNKCLLYRPPLLISLEGSHYRSLWKWNEWEHKGMDGRSWPQGLWGVRTHKLITWYWWRTSMRLPCTSALATSAIFDPYSSSKHQVIRQEQFLTQMMFKNSPEKHIWKPLSGVDWNQKNQTHILNRTGHLKVSSLLSLLICVIAM